MSLADFVRALPKNWATAPIYAKGATLPSGRIACGKSPLGRASRENLSPELTATYIEKSPETFTAVGVYTGTRSNGLVIFDVDYNLGAIEEKWGEDLKSAPQIKSPKDNAGKFLFVVPEDDRLKVASISHVAAGQEGWEVLWGAQGVLKGAYKEGGEYVLTGDLNAIPQAPEWLLERMREQYRKVNQKDSGRQLRDTRYSMRSREEKIAIARSCLSVIEPRGANSERYWWEIGAMIHSELPTEDGLKLWEEWSRRDNEYAHDWENGNNPCRKRWEDGFRGGGLGFGSLIREADQFDENRTRFQRDGLASLVEEIQAAPVKYKLEYLDGEELLARAEELEETIENPALLDQAKTILAAEAGRMREGAAAIDRLLDAHLTFKRNDGCKPADVNDLDDTPFDYLIPGLIPKPWLLLLHADGGTGKSAMCQTLCKHISQQIPFNVHGGLVGVSRGKCLWLNGDQSERVTRRQFNLIGVEKGVDVVGEWDMQWYRQFCRIQKKHQYDLVVIDSLDGCNDSNPYEENRREYALPLKRLARRNGKDFPACSIIVIHHNNRNGGFRGTSAIRAAVDETWNMQRMENKKLLELGLRPNTRIVTVEKSRDDREGQQMVFTLKDDYTYEIGPVPKAGESGHMNGPTEQMLGMLEVMRQNRRPWSIQAFVDHDSKLGGIHKKRAIRYSLEKLEAQKLIERCPAPAEFKGKGRPPAFWQALGTDVPGGFTSRAREKTVSSGGFIQTPSAGTDLKRKEVAEKVQDCKKSETRDFLQKMDFSQTPIAVKKPSPGTDLNKSPDNQRHKGEPESGDEWTMWD
mgnify:FL=1